MNMNASPKITILLADDHSIMMRGFALMLEDAGFEVLATIADPSLIVESFEKFNPDVLVLDVIFGEGHSGLEAIEAIRSRHPNASLVVLSQSNRYETIQDAFRLGANAYITKDCSIDELIKGIHSALEGKKYCTEKIGSSLAAEFVQRSSDLSAHETTVMRLVAEGLTLEEIGNRLGKSKRDMSREVMHLKRKFGVERTAELVRIAVKRQIID
jgi:DNA-binding NarL/FixJ family response regulator